MRIKKLKVDETWTGGHEESLRQRSVKINNGIFLCK